MSTPQGLQGSLPPIFDLRGSSCVDDLPNILTCFIFSLQRNFWIPQVAVILICNAPSVQFLIQQLNRTAFEWQLAYLQLPVSNWDTWILRTTHQECTISHHFEMKNSNFLGRGASILASSALDLRPPMFQWRLRPWILPKYSSYLLTKRTIFYVSVAYPMGRRRHYVFALSVRLCVCACVPCRGILRPACRQLVV